MSKPEPVLENAPGGHHIPSEKTIIYPVWRDTNKHGVTLDTILGQFARWAVEQSPYTCPDNLETAIKVLGEIAH